MSREEYENRAEQINCDSYRFEERLSDKERRLRIDRASSEGVSVALDLFNNV